MSEKLRVYATHKGKVIEVRVLSVSDSHVRVSVDPSPFDEAQEFRLPLADLRACRQVRRVWVDVYRQARKRRRNLVIKRPLEFFLSEELAKTYLTVGRDATAAVEAIESDLRDAAQKLEALLGAGGQIPQDSPIRTHIAQLQGILDGEGGAHLSLVHKAGE